MHLDFIYNLLITSLSLTSKCQVGPERKPELGLLKVLFMPYQPTTPPPPNPSHTPSPTPKVYKFELTANVPTPQHNLHAH